MIIGQHTTKTEFESLVRVVELGVAVAVAVAVALGVELVDIG